MNWILVGVAGAAGALARHLVGGWVRGRAGPGAFPWGTFAVNISGSFLLGLLTGLVTGRGLLSAEVKLVLGTGFLGAYTTFSTWQLDLFQALRRGDATTALLNLALSAGLGLLAAWTGLAVGWGR